MEWQWLFVGLNWLECVKESSDGVEATAKDFTYKATGNKIKSAEYFTHLLSNR